MARLTVLHCIALQATRRGVWVSNILSAGTGNALSCAEHAIYLMLATLRRELRRRSEAVSA